MTALKLFATASAAAMLTALPACAESAETETQGGGSESAAMNAGAETTTAQPQDSAMQTEPEMNADTVSEAVSTIINRDREEVGTATFRQGPDGVVVTIEADLGEGSGAWHGAHLHQIGDCSNDDFTSSGGHINTLDNAHGFLNADGPDNADLPNVWLHSDGTMRAQAYTTRVSVDGQTGAPSLLDSDGSALVIHENPDDMESQPIGGAGSRILCAVIEAGGQ